MTTDDGVLEITTRIAARAPTVFRHFTDPERFGRWMGAAFGVATLEPEVGGAVRVEFPEAGLVVVGEVLELTPDERFVFTWGFEGENQPIPAGSSRVEITLRPFDDGTVLTLRHSGLPGAAARQQHRAGWRLYTSVLASGCAADQVGERLPARVADWFFAWAETDSAKRSAILARCCTPDVEYRDRYAAIAGLEDLDGHVGISQQSVPDAVLEHAGDLVACHDHVKFGWRASMGGRVVATGCNVGRVDLDGRFRSVHGFRDEPAG